MPWAKTVNRSAERRARRWPLRGAAALAALAVAVGGVAVATPAAATAGSGASSTMARTWGVNGHVEAIAPAGDVVVIGGSFDTALSPSGDTLAVDNVALFRPASGVVEAWPVSTDGSVQAVAVDGDTAYLGGDFRHVNGELRISLAAVSLSTGALLPWAPEANVWVNSLAVSGGWVYLGGAFDTVTDAGGDVAAPYLARVSVADGTVDRTWSTAAPDAPVRSLLVDAAGTGIYVGGDFTAVDGQEFASRLTLLSTGATPDLDPVFRSGLNNEDHRAPVLDLALDGDALLMGSGGAGGGCTVQDAATGATRWSHHATGDVAAVAFLGPMAYCGGHFSGSASFDNLTRYKMAEMVTATGEITSTRARVNSALGVWALASSPTALFAGGDFTKVSGTLQPHFGMFADTSAIVPPATPKNVEARAGDGQVVLIWDAPDTDGGAKIRKYKVYRRLGPGRLTLLAKTKGLSLVDGTVVNGTVGDPASTYRYAVRAVTSAGVSDLSAVVEAVPQAGLVIAPSAPHDLTASGSLGAAELTWSPPVTDGGSPVTAYVVLRGTTSGVLDPLTTLPGEATSYTDTAVSVGQRYYYAVAAVNAIGPGTASKQATASPNTGVPGAPRLTAAPADTGPGMFLTWEPSAITGAAPVKAYVLTRDGVRIYRGSGSVLEYTDASAASGVTYRYRVRAVNDYGSSPWSDAVIVTAP